MENTLCYKLEGFEGPLDLLLQLIARNKFNIYDIPLTELIDQYLEQIKLFQQEEMELSSEFLEMASRLLYIKTVSLLPKHDEIVKLKEELTGELLEYMVCQQVARQLGSMQGGLDRYIKAPSDYDLTRPMSLFIQAMLSIFLILRLWAEESGNYRPLPHRLQR